MSAISLVASFHLMCSLLDLLRTRDAGAWPLAGFFVVVSCVLCSVQERGLGALEGQQKINHAGRRAPQAPGCPGEVSRHRVSCEAPRSSWSSAGGAARPEGLQGRRGRGAGRRRWEKEPEHVAPGGAPGAWELPHPTFWERKVRTGFLVGGLLQTTILGMLWGKVMSCITHTCRVPAADVWLL